MQPIDLAIVVVYILAMFFFAAYIGLRSTSEDFLVLSRRAGPVLIVFSIVSTWVGVGVFVGTASAAYDSGLSFGLTGAVGAAVAVLAAGAFAPRIKRFGDAFQAHTLGDFFRIRYSPGTGRLAALVVVLVYLTFTAVQFTGLSTLLQVWGGFDLRVAMALTAVTTIIYTAFAGIKSDFYTDVVHFCVMVVVFFGIVLPIVLQRSDRLAVFHSLPQGHLDPFNFGGVAYFFGGILIGLGIVFVSMELWQRIYAATSPATARWSLVGSAFVVIPFYIFATVVGMYARVAYPDLPDRDLALFVFIKDHLRPGILGFGVAALIALFISSVNTMIMVVSATVTKDFLRPQTTNNDPKTLMVARVVTLVAGTVGLMLSYVVADIVTLSIVALFMLLVMLPSALGGFFWPRSTATAAFWSILVGLVGTGVALPVMPESAFVPGFLASLIVFVVVSFRTRHGSTERRIAEESA
jgi:solute:Na+ symporter, SSS family